MVDATPPGSSPARARPRRTLAVRLTLSFLLPTVLGLAAVGFVADLVSRRAFEAQLDERLISVAHAERAILDGYFAELAGRVDGADTRSLANLRRRIARIAEQTGVRRVFLFHPEHGTSIVDTDPGIPFGHTYYELDSDRLEVERARDGESAASILYTADDDTAYKYAYAPLYAEDGRLVAIIGVEGASSLAEDLAEVRRTLLLLGALAIVLLVATSFFVSRRLTRPVAKLVEATGRIGSGELETPVARTRDDELGELEAAIDQMRLALSERDEAMQLMLSGIAHEVRNPLGGIELFLGLLDEDLAAEGRSRDDALRGHVRTMNRELEYLSRVVNEFLEFARRSRVERTRFPARAFADELAELMAGDMLAAGIELRLEVEPQDLELTADRDRLKRVVVNLVRNARQASLPDTTITLRLGGPRDSLRTIEVIDQGTGIAPEVLANMFRPFFTTREKGTGLGLALARKVVEAHGGTLTVASVLGEGTQVRIELPFDATIEAAMSSAQMDIPEGWLG